MNETLKKMVAELETSWNETDAKLYEEYDRLLDNDYMVGVGGGRKIHASTKFLAGLTVHEAAACRYRARWYESENYKAALKFVLALQAKVIAITGEITAWEKGPQSEQSLYTYNVKGVKGAAQVRQIHAGGYNIVRLHIRNIIRAM